METNTDQSRYNVIREVLDDALNEAVPKLVQDIQRVFRPQIPANAEEAGHPAAALPLHPELAALALPPLPWKQGEYSRSIVAADNYEVAWTSHTKPPGQRQTREEVEAITNVVAAAPDMLNVLLFVKAQLSMTQARPVGDGNLLAAINAVVARALGQKGGSHA